jgi:hypothetical protein
VGTIGQDATPRQAASGEGGKAALLGGCDNPRGVTLEQVMELTDRIVASTTPRDSFELVISSADVGAS